MAQNNSFKIHFKTRNEARDFSRKSRKLKTVPASGSWRTTHRWAVQVRQG